MDPVISLDATLSLRALSSVVSYELTATQLAIAASM